MGSFPVAIPDIASRAEYVRSQLETLRVSTFSDKNFMKNFCDSFGEINFQIYLRISRMIILENYYYYFFLLSFRLESFITKFKVRAYRQD